MAEKKDKIIKSANTYLELGKLLKKKRGSWASREIEKIINTDLSNEKKLSLIRKVDHSVLLQKEIIQKKNKPKETKPHKDLKVSAMEELPNPFTKVNFFSFMIFHFQRVYRFGKKTNTLNAKWMNLNFKLKDEVGATLQEVKKIVQDLFDPLHYIVEKGWRVLDKEAYNLVLAFYEFCDDYYKELINNKFDYTDLILIQKQFLALIQEKYYAELLVNSITDGLADTNYSKKIEDITQKVKMIIDEHSMKPSLTHIFLAVQMIEMKRYYSLKNLLAIEKPPFIKKNRYMANDEILNRIRQYLWQKELLLAEKEKESRYIAFVIRQYIADWENHSFKFLKGFAFVESKHEVNEEGNGKNFIEKQDMVFFSSSLLKEYLKVFKQYTLDKVAIITTEGRVIHERITPYTLSDQFKNILSKQHLLDDLLRNKVIERTTFERYRDYVREGKSISQGELTLFDILKELAQNFYEISVRLYRNYAFELELNSKSQDERIRLLQDKDIFERSIPFSKGRLSLNYFLSNKTVLETYLDLIHFSVNFALLYENKDLIDIFQNQDELRDEIKELKLLLQRMK